MTLRLTGVVWQNECREMGDGRLRRIASARRRAACLSSPKPGALYKGLLMRIAIVVLCMFLAGGPTLASESRCFGTPAKGRLENGARLPLRGENFRSYSMLGWGMGRTYVHSRVSDVLLDAFGEAARATPGVEFVYAETGWRRGGPFYPHRTHQNGLSVDIMVPVLRDGKPALLPLLATNRFGYDIEFDDRGQYGDFTIDFDALGQLLYALHRAAIRHGVPIERVIFEVPLQSHLFRAQRGAYLRRNLVFSKRQAWVRHDEHIHIDFRIPCR